MQEFGKPGDFETLGEAALHAERAALLAYQAALKMRRAVRPDDRRGEFGDRYDALVDATQAAWIEAFERRWVLA